MPKHQEYTECLETNNNRIVSVDFFFVYSIRIPCVCVFTVWSEATIIIIQYNRIAVLFVVLNIITPKRSCFFFVVGTFAICFLVMSKFIFGLTFIFLTPCDGMYDYMCGCVHASEQALAYEL